MSARGPTLKCQVHAVWSGDLTHLRFIAADVCVEEFEQSVEADVSLAVSAALHLLPALRAGRLAAHSHANCSHAYTECVCSKRFCHSSKVAPPYLLQYRVLMLYLIFVDSLELTIELSVRDANRESWKLLCHSQPFLDAVSAEAMHAA